MRALRKVMCVGPGLAVSTVLVLLIVGPALPPAGKATLLLGGLGVLAWLLTGVAEPVAARGLFLARGPRPHERPALAQLSAELAGLEVGPKQMVVLVSRARGAPWAIARGRRTVVVAADLAHDLATGRLPTSAGVAPVAHAASVARLGLNRHDPAIAFWSLPWAILVGVGRSVVRILGPLWSIRPLVAGVAVWQSITGPVDPAAPGPHGAALGAAVAALLGLTYAVPWAERSWDRYVTRAADQALIADGLGPAMAAWLGRLPQTPDLIARRHRLTGQIGERSGGRSDTRSDSQAVAQSSGEPETPGPQRPHLRLVRS